MINATIAATEAKKQIDASRQEALVRRIRALTVKRDAMQVELDKINSLNKTELTAYCENLLGNRRAMGEDV